MLKRRQIEWVLDHEAEPQLAFSARACSSPSSEGVGCARTHERPTAVVADLMCGKGRIGRQLHQKGWMLIEGSGEDCMSEDEVMLPAVEVDKASAGPAEQPPMPLPSPHPVIAHRMRAQPIPRPPRVGARVKVLRDLGKVLEVTNFLPGSMVGKAVGSSVQPQLRIQWDDWNIKESSYIWWSAHYRSVEVLSEPDEVEQPARRRRTAAAHQGGSSGGGSDGGSGTQRRRTASAHQGRSSGGGSSGGGRDGGSGGSSRGSGIGGDHGGSSAGRGGISICGSRGGIAGGATSSGSAQPAVSQRRLKAVVAAAAAAAAGRSSSDDADAGIGGSGSSTSAGSSGRDSAGSSRAGGRGTGVSGGAAGKRRTRGSSGEAVRPRGSGHRVIQFQLPEEDEDEEEVEADEEVVVEEAAAAAAAADAEEAHEPPEAQASEVEGAAAVEKGEGHGVAADAPAAEDDLESLSVPELRQRLREAAATLPGGAPSAGSAGSRGCGCLIGDGVEVRASTVDDAGLGLFAMRAFGSREVITEYQGELVPSKEHARQRCVQTHLMQREGIYVDGRLLRLMYKREPESVLGCGGGTFVNHKKGQERNAEFFLQTREGPGLNRIFVRVGSGRAVQPGDEIYASYGSEISIAIAMGNESLPPQRHKRLRDVAPAAAAAATAPKARRQRTSAAAVASAVASGGPSVADDAAPTAAVDAAATAATTAAAATASPATSTAGSNALNCIDLEAEDDAPPTDLEVVAEGDSEPEVPLAPTPVARALTRPSPPCAPKVRPASHLPAHAPAHLSARAPAGAVGPWMPQLGELCEGEWSDGVWAAARVLKLRDHSNKRSDIVIVQYLDEEPPYRFGRRYEAKANETLCAIATRLELPVSALMQYNPSLPSPSAKLRPMTEVWLPHIHLAGSRETLSDIGNIYSRSHAPADEREAELTQLIGINASLLEHVQAAGTVGGGDDGQQPVDLTEEVAPQDVELPEMAVVVLPLTWLPSSLRLRRLLPQREEIMFVRSEDVLPMVSAVGAAGAATEGYAEMADNAGEEGEETGIARAMVTRHKAPYIFCVKLLASGAIRELHVDDLQAWWRDRTATDVAVGDRIFLEYVDTLGDDDPSVAVAVDEAHAREADERLLCWRAATVRAVLEDGRFTACVDGDEADLHGHFECTVQQEGAPRDEAWLRPAAPGLKVFKTERLSVSAAKKAAATAKHASAQARDAASLPTVHGLVRPPPPPLASTDPFIASLERFTMARGQPLEVRYDLRWWPAVLEGWAGGQDEEGDGKATYKVRIVRGQSDLVVVHAERLRPRWAFDDARGEWRRLQREEVDDELPVDDPSDAPPFDEENDGDHFGVPSEAEEDDDAEEEGGGGEEGGDDNKAASGSDPEVDEEDEASVEERLLALPAPPSAEQTFIRRAGKDPDRDLSPQDRDNVYQLLYDAFSNLTRNKKSDTGHIRKYLDFLIKGRLPESGEVINEINLMTSSPSCSLTSSHELLKHNTFEIIYIKDTQTSEVLAAATLVFVGAGAPAHEHSRRIGRLDKEIVCTIVCWAVAKKARSQRRSQIMLWHLFRECKRREVAKLTVLSAEPFDYAPEGKPWNWWIVSAAPRHCAHAPQYTTADARCAVLTSSSAPSCSFACVRAPRSGGTSSGSRLRGLATMRKRGGSGSCSAWRTATPPTSTRPGSLNTEAARPRFETCTC